MAAQGRKNVHGKTGVRFKAAYTPSKNKSMLRNVVTDLIIYGEVKVTSGVTKDLKSLADHMALVTWGYGFYKPALLEKAKFVLKKPKNLAQVVLFGRPFSLKDPH